MDESENESTKSELSDSWMVINETPADQIKDNGTPSEGSDGESVEVIDQEDYDEVLTGETDYDAAQTEEELNGPKNKKYVHHPNEDVNAALNRLMVIAASIVVGLAVGHYLGYSEEVNDMSTTLKKLQAENFKLKNHICMTLENYDKHIMHIPGTAYPELKYFNDNYAVFLTVLLNLTCPHTEAKILDLQTTLGDVRQALLDGHMSDDELYGRIGKILQSRPSDREVIDYKKISDEAQIETVTTEDKELTSTDSQITETVTLKEHSSESRAHAESLKAKIQEESSTKKEVVENILGLSNLEHAPVRVQVGAKAVRSELSEGLIDSLAKSSPKIYEGFQEATDSKDSPGNKEVPHKNMLKHIVKDVVQEVTESLLALHHDDIIRDIRNEAKKLTESFPLFKSALLLNMEVTAKLKSHLKYVKDMLYSVLENSLHVSDKGKIDEIFRRVDLHTLHLEKAMDSLNLMEVTLNPKRTGTLNVERSNVCTVSDFLKDVFINNHHNTHTMENIRKHSNDPHKKDNKYTANQSPSGTTVENLSQKSTMESDEEIFNMENLQKIEGDDKFSAELPLDARPSKYDRRQTREVKDKKKKKQDHNNKKHKKSKPLSVETKQYSEKDEGKYKNFKTTKDKHLYQEKKLKKQHHYKEEKSFKNEEYDRRKKYSYHMYKWDKDSDYGHSNMTGDWVTEMSRARAESRENEHKSDWLFERAYARKAKRNGKWDMNNWYFQRAEGRRSCRQKSCNEKSKFPYPPPNDSEKEYHDNNNKQHQKQKKYFKPKRWISKAYMTVSKFRF